MKELYMIQLLFCSNTKNMPYRSNKSKIYEENLALTATRSTVDGWLVKKRRCEKISFHSRVMCTDASPFVHPHVHLKVVWIAPPKSLGNHFACFVSLSFAPPHLTDLRQSSFHPSEAANNLGVASSWWHVSVAYETAGASVHEYFFRNRVLPQPQWAWRYATKKVRGRIVDTME
jgi:hypothetical protein